MADTARLEDGTLAPVAWRAQAGPQSALIACPCFEVFFGGARGGGKTDGVLGDWLVHSDKYGPDAIGLMVRRERTQLIETIERSRAIFTPIGAKFHEQEKMWRMPGGGRLRFAYLERDADADSYQGHSYCVAVDTRIRMADGSLKPIEAIGIGELVATLEGPRRVSGATPPYVAPCVKAVVRDSEGSVVGDQIHPVWHPVLTTSGLILSPSSQGRQTGVRPRSVQRAAGKRGQGSSAYADRAPRGWSAWSEDARSGYRGSPGTPREIGQPRRLTVPVVLHALTVQSAIGQRRASQQEPTGSHASGKWSESWSGLSRVCRALSWGLQRLREHARSVMDRCSPCPPNALSGALIGCRGVPSFRSDYLPGRGCDGGRALDPSGTGRDGIPSPDDAGNRRLAWPSGASDTIRPHSRSASGRWVHPYTGEERCLSEEVISGTMEAEYFGPALVADLTVEDANHYISEYGLINKNTRVYIEEAGTFPDPMPINKLKATLRSGAGVPGGMRLTGNPGGPGHQWVKARYIDPAPMGMKIILEPFKNPWTGEIVQKDRVFIPSKLGDNHYLGGEYVATLQMLGNEALVKAWLEGDWTIVDGAFFDTWSATKHILRPFEIPESWTKFRSMDWGFSRPFSVGWWAIAGDNYDTSEKIIPRGALVRYREWYGSNGQPNVGLRMNAADVGRGILERETGDRIAYGVIDPAAFAQDSGPSIAEQMSAVKLGDRRLSWSPADNKRVAQRGAIGGWNEMRSRLTGLEDKPMLYVFSTCKDFIRTVPAMQHDPTRPEDIDTDGEDHIADEARYACMSRPWTPPAVAQRSDRYRPAPARSRSNSWMTA